MHAFSKEEKREQWYVVQVRPNAENEAVSHLRQQNFQVFYPSVRRTVRHARQFREKTSPVFPGYVFVCFDPASALWRRINGTRGVVSLIAMSGAPATLPEQVMSSLLAKYGSNLKDRAPSLAVGEPIRLMAGPFANLVGRFTTLGPRGRIEVLLDILGMQVKVRSDRLHVSPAPAA